MDIFDRIDLSEDELALLRRYESMERALKDFRYFVEVWMRPTGHPDFQYDWEDHHAVIGEAFQDVADGKIKRLILSVSPGAAKTTLHVQWRAWMAARDPHGQFIAVAATQALAETIGRRVRSAIQTKEWELLACTQLHADQQSVANFGYGNGGVQASFGLGAKLIGRRATSGIAVDDYVGSYEDVATEAQREKAWEWFRGALMSRLTPDAPLVVIGTRWEPDDIIGKILKSHEADEWTYIRMPMECDDPESDPLNRQMGERLWNSYYNQQEIDSYKLDVKNWHCMWQCRPLLEQVDWLPLENLPITQQRPQGLTNFYVGCDIALTEGAGDYTVLAVGALTPERKLVILDMVRKRITPDKIIEEMVALHKKYEISEFLMDDDNASKVLMNLANEMLRRQGVFLPFKKMPMNGQNKEIRAAPFKGLALQGGVELVVGPWNEAFLSEVSTFPREASTIHDDTIDAVGLLAKRLAAMTTGHIPMPKAPEKITTLIQQDEHGQQWLTPTLNDLWSEREEAILSASRRRRI